MNKGEFISAINDLWARTKRGELSREERFKEIEKITDEYIAETGERPEPSALDRLATLCLYEEMTDSRSNKMRAEESPVMSSNQYRRRKEGRHVRSKTASGEVTLNRALDYGTDNRNYGYPKRRKLTTDEALVMDKSLSRDKEKAKRYLQESRNGKVEISYVD